MKICFVFINHIYLTLRSGFHFNLLNMIFTIEAEFRLDTKWKNTAPWVTPFRHLCWRSDCYPVTGPKFCTILLTNYWAHITFSQIYHVMMYTLDVVGNFMQSIENDRSPKIILCSFNFGHCKLYFSLITLCMWNALKWQYLVVVGAKPFPANQNIKYECFHWASKYSKLLAGSVFVSPVYINKTIKSWYSGVRLPERILWIFSFNIFINFEVGKIIWWVARHIGFTFLLIWVILTCFTSKIKLFSNSRPHNAGLFLWMGYRL